MSRSQQRWMGVVAILLGLSLSLRAQLEQPDNASGDDPNRGAARVSAIQGDVNVKRGDSGEVVAAVLNAPLMAQDQLQTAGGSRSEVQFDGANLVRLAPDTELAFAVIAQGRYQMQLSSGTIIYRMLRDIRIDAEIDTPSISVRPRAPGVYRISVYGEGTTAVTVRQGQAEIDSPKGSQILQARQTMLVRGPSADPEFQTEGEIAQDQFDDWSNNRDQSVEQAAAPYVHVPPEVAGAGELGAYGTWVPSTYGTVWAPRVAPGWAPYQYGRWVWEDYYGWTWVDYDPWGWAPFHYGRWFWNGGRGWCWWPGAIGRPHYWRPALVGFFGFGAGGVGVGIGFGFGNVGWVALAPREMWHPWYGRGWYGRGGYNRVVTNNVFVHNVNIYNSFRNARINNGVAYMNANSFGQGTHGFYRASGAQIREASLVHGQLPLTPSRNSLAFSNRAPASIANNFARSGQQHFFTHQRSPALERTSFSQQQQHMAQFQERTLGVRPNLNAQRSGFAQMNPRQTAQRGTSNTSPNTSAPQAQPGYHWNGQTGNGWHRVGQSTPQAAAAAQQPRNNGNPPSANSWRPQANQGGEARQNRAPADGGWHRFGDPGASSYTRQGSPSTGTRGWHTFGAPGDFSQPRTPQNRESYRNNFGAPRQSSPSQSFRSAEPMRMNPPIVHDRPNYPAMRNNSAPRPSYNRPSGGGSFGSPRMNGGTHFGGGGGSRPSGGNHGGGGGGGNHGGGGHRR